MSVKAGERPFYHLVLLAKNLKGYQNLVYLASKAYTEGWHYKPRIDLDLLAERSEGLIGLSSGYKGAVWHFLRENNEEKALENANIFKDIFGSENFYLEIQDHGLKDEQEINRKIVRLSKNAGIPLVATNDAHYLNEEDARAQEILLCIGEGKTINDSTRTVFGSTKYYLRSADEMWTVFGRELPDSLNNTLKIAESCQVELPMGDNLALPSFPIPPESACQTTEEYFEIIVKDGFKERKQIVWDNLKETGNLIHLRIMKRESKRKSE